MHRLNKLVSRNVVDGLPTHKFERNRICNACQKGKQSKTSFKMKNFVSTSRLLELLHMDLFGLSRTMSLGGNYYGFVIVDDYSRFTWTAFIVTNDHAFSIFKGLSKILQNENNCNICAIKTNHGGEFQNEKFENFCNKRGIKHNFSAPITPQQNA